MGSLITTEDFLAAVRRVAERTLAASNHETIEEGLAAREDDTEEEKKVCRRAQLSGLDTTEEAVSELLDRLDVANHEAALIATGLVIGLDAAAHR